MFNIVAVNLIIRFVFLKKINKKRTKFYFQKKVHLLFSNI